MGWMLSTAWTNGLRSEVQTFAGASLPAPWGTNSGTTGIVRTDIDANRTLVTDQAGKQRISKTNSLGHLTNVWEIRSSDASTVSVTFPGTGISHGYQTSYEYDVLNNLLHVDQGVQDREFTYSSLSRLLSAENPESGVIEYEYDNNGNLVEKTDARGILTSYVYDHLNRVTDRTYANEPSGSETADVEYTYGTASPKVGKLTKVESSVSTTEYTSFDILGRVTASKQTTDNTDYTSSYSYNLSGALIEQTYPSGRKVKNVLDNSGDLALVQSRRNSSEGYWNYASSFLYNPAGAVTKMQLGNGRWESTQFNSRLQPTQIALGSTPGAVNLLDLDYSYGTTDNNGNVMSQTVTFAGLAHSFIQTYTYDSLNRIDDSSETYNTAQIWRQDFTYDLYGNRSLVEANTTTLPKNCGSSPNFTVCAADRKVLNPASDPANNRLDTDEDYAYDASGNTVEDAQGKEFIYDAENKQVKVVEGADTIGEYWYDGDGKRVRKHVPGDGIRPGEVTVFVYDAAGKLMAEYSTIVESTNNARVAYLTNDYLGTPRINTDANGSVTSRHDYHPFGDEISTSQRTNGLGYVDDTVRKQFTGYERDGETELDFAQARYFASGFGRFTTVDPLLASASTGNPQTFNRYAFVLNSPYKFHDPTGMMAELPEDCPEDCVAGDESPEEPSPPPPIIRLVGASVVDSLPSENSPQSTIAKGYTNDGVADLGSTYDARIKLTEAEGPDKGKKMYLRADFDLPAGGTFTSKADEKGVNAVTVSSRSGKNMSVATSDSKDGPTPIVIAGATSLTVYTPLTIANPKEPASLVVNLNLRANYEASLYSDGKYNLGNDRNRVVNKTFQVGIKY